MDELPYYWITTHCTIPQEFNPFKKNPQPTQTESKQLEVVQPFFIKFLRRLCKEINSPYDIQDTHSFFYLDNKAPDVSVVKKDQAVLASTVMVVGELKLPSTNAFTPHNEGEIFTYLERVLRKQPLRSHADGFLSDCYKIRFYRVVRLSPAEEFSFIVSGITELACKEGNTCRVADGALYLGALLSTPAEGMFPASTWLTRPKTSDPSNTIYGRTNL